MRSEIEAHIKAALSEVIELMKLAHAGEWFARAGKRTRSGGITRRRQDSARRFTAWRGGVGIGTLDLNGIRAPVTYFFSNV